MKRLIGGPGRYVAICNNTNSDGHYIKEFEVPDTPEFADVSASWYFCNVVDLTACVDKIYPAEIFDSLREEVSK